LIVAIAEDEYGSDHCPHAAKDFVVSWHETRMDKEIGNYLVAKYAASGQHDPADDRLAPAQAPPPRCFTVLFCG
jgi:hypothetical protein